MKEGERPTDEVQVREEVHDPQHVTNDRVDDGHRRAVVVHDANPGRSLAGRLAAPGDLEEGEVDDQQEERAAQDGRQNHRRARAEGRCDLQGDRQQDKAQDGDRDNEMVD